MPLLLLITSSEAKVQLFDHSHLGERFRNFEILSSHFLHLVFYRSSTYRDIMRGYDDLRRLDVLCRTFFWQSAK